LPSSVKVLNISYNKFSRVAAEALAEAVGRLLGLEELSIANTGLDLPGASLLSGALPMRLKSLKP